MRQISRQPPAPPEGRVDKFKGVNKVCKRSSLMAESASFAKQLASGPTQAFAMIKDCVERVFQLDLASGLAVERENFNKIKDAGEVMKIKILGICSSPLKNGNTAAFLDVAIGAAEEEGDVETEVIKLYGKTGQSLRGCNHCNWCALKQGRDGRFCQYEDEDIMGVIYRKMLEADGFLFATPVYDAKMSGSMANLFDRLRAVGHGKVYRGALEGKVGGALAVTWHRNAGVETCLLTIVHGFMTWDIIPVGCDLICQFGAAGVSSYGGTGKFDADDRLLVLKDEWGLKNARMLAKRVVKLARTIKAGKLALKGAKNQDVEPAKSLVEPGPN